MNISFCHYANEKMASYRYRALIPSLEIGAKINNPDAEVMIFSKPIDQDIGHISRAKMLGKTVIADFCDMHFHLDYYRIILRQADAVTCPTQWFADYLSQEYGIEAVVVPDPYEFDELAPHCNDDKLLWFGHAMNVDGLQRVLPQLEGHPLAIVSNLEGATPWSKEAMLSAFSKADMVVMPETAPYKSPNRTIESIRQGCFVVAEPHPSINDIPGIWIGNIKEGIEWAQQNLSEANERTRLAQDYIRNAYSPATQANAWRIAIQKAQSCSTSDVAIFDGGMVGPELTPIPEAGKPTMSQTL